MKLIQTLLIVLMAAAIAGCSSTPKEKKVAEPKTRKIPNVKAVATFNQPVAKAQQASVDALSVVGCNIVKQEPTYVEGYRPHKMGAFIGSGGEHIKVWLEAAEPQKTIVHVGTFKSPLGLAGQKNWDREVMEELTKSLGK